MKPERLLGVQTPKHAVYVRICPTAQGSTAQRSAEIHGTLKPILELFCVHTSVLSLVCSGLMGSTHSVPLGERKRDHRKRTKERFSACQVKQSQREATRSCQEIRRRSGAGVVGVGSTGQRKNSDQTQKAERPRAAIREYYSCFSLDPASVAELARVTRWCQSLLMIPL